jgi:hypothetical protein
VAIDTQDPGQAAATGRALAGSVGVTKIQDASDFGSTPGPGNDGYARVWDNDEDAAYDRM